MPPYCLFMVSFSDSSSPSFILLCVCLYSSYPLSLLCLMLQITTVLCYITSNARSLHKKTFYCFPLHLLISSLYCHSFLLLLSFYIAKTMQFKCPDATSCKLSETRKRSLSYSRIQQRKQSCWSYWGQVGVQSFFNWTNCVHGNVTHWLTILWRQGATVKHTLLFSFLFIQVCEK